MSVISYDYITDCFFKFFALKTILLRFGNLFRAFLYSGIRSLCNKTNCLVYFSEISFHEERQKHFLTGCVYYCEMRRDKYNFLIK